MFRRHHRIPSLIGALTVAILLLPAGGAGDAAAAPQEPGASVSGPLRVDPLATYQITRLTGNTSLNRTDLRWNVYGTDLGSMFLHRGRLYLLFGDTFGAPGHPPTFGGDWRSNTMAYTSDTNPRDGLRFDGMITDRPGHAKVLIDQAMVPGNEVTVIPTNGISVDGRIFLHYMAVSQWGPPGQWSLSRSGLAYSDDNGQTFTVSERAVWPGDSNFGQVAFVRHGDWVYLFGIPGGRFGAAELARVDRHRLLDPTAYRYFDGTGWTADPAAARPVVPAPVGELSVQWNSYYHRWLMMYLNDRDHVVVLRTARCLTGPWSAEQPVVTAQDVPQLYAPYLPPRWNDGSDIYFTLSRFDRYGVFWWHTALSGSVAPDQGCGAG